MAILILNNFFINNPKNKKVSPLDREIIKQIPNIEFEKNFMKIELINM